MRRTHVPGYSNTRHPSDAQTQAEKLGVDVSGATIVDPETAPELERYIEDLVDARKKKVQRLEILMSPSV